MGQCVSGCQQAGAWCRVGSRTVGSECLVLPTWCMTRAAGRECGVRGRCAVGMLAWLQELPFTPGYKKQVLLFILVVGLGERFCPEIQRDCLENEPADFLISPAEKLPMKMRKSLGALENYISYFPTGLKLYEHICQLTHALRSEVAHYNANSEISFFIRIEPNLNRLAKQSI